MARSNKNSLTKFAKLTNIFLRRSYVLLLIIILYLTCQVIASLDTFKIQHIVIKNNKIVPQHMILTQMGVTENDNIFGLSKKEIKQKIYHLPQIEKAKIYKIPPNKIQVIIFEKKPFASIITPLKKYIIDDRGNILNIPTVIQYFDIIDIPVIEGPNIVKTISGNVFIEPDQKLFLTESLQILKKHFPKTHIQIEVSEYKKISVIIDDILKIKIGAMTDVEKKFKTLKLLLPEIKYRWQQVEYVDVRFPTYPTIKWREK